MRDVHHLQGPCGRGRSLRERGPLGEAEAGGGSSPRPSQHMGFAAVLHVLGRPFALATSTRHFEEPDDESDRSHKSFDRSTLFTVCMRFPDAFRSWPSDALAPEASSGVVKVRPSVGFDRRVHSGDRRCCHLRPAGSSLPGPIAFRPRGFSPPRRVPPLRSPRDVAPDADPGVRRVSAGCEPTFPRRLPALRSLLPPPQQRAADPKVRATREIVTAERVSPRIPTFTGLLAPSPFQRHPLARAPLVDLEALLHDGSGATRRTFPLDPGPCSPGLAPRRCRRCRRAAVSPPWRAPVARCSS